MKICSLLFSLPLLILISEIYSATITVNNNCQYTIWPATLTGGNGAQLSNTGFELNPLASTSVDVPSPWTGRFWGRTQCSTDSSGKFTCATGDCGSGQLACNGAGGAPPVTLAEFTIASSGGQDFYDVSVVDGFNVPLSITPQGGSGPNCTTTSCAANINADCPSNLAVTGSSGSTIGCKSACDEYNQPQYCCTGAYDSPSTCEPTNYSMFFKSQCPQAYSYAYDDNSSLYSCNGSPNYVITFCP